VGLVRLHPLTIVAGGQKQRRKKQVASRVRKFLGKMIERVDGCC
jgi:hypothetical protein